MRSLVRPLLVASSFFAATTAFCQGPGAPAAPKPGTVIQNAPAQRPFPSQGAVEFERNRLDFAPQSIGVENCANIPLNNTMDNPRVLTKLVVLDPEHFSVSSPSDAMLPLTLGGNSSLYLNLCFKSDKAKDYQSALLAIFGSDTTRLILTGKAVVAPVAMPAPKELNIELKKGKKNTTDIELAMSRHGYIRLAVENSLGKAVRTFPFDDVKSPGYYQVTFDGKGDDGKKLECGNYVLRMEVVDTETKEKVHASKVLKVK